MYVFFCAGSWFYQMFAAMLTVMTVVGEDNYCISRCGVYSGKPLNCLSGNVFDESMNPRFD